MLQAKKTVLMIIEIVLVILLFLAILAFGQVEIPLKDVATVLLGGEAQLPSWQIIILESRLPMALTALLAGLALSCSGLLLQTTFRNPLAGPSILGISAGASLGVAFVMLALASSPAVDSGIRESGAFAGAIIGAGVITALLATFSSLLKNNLSLLIVGIMVSYLASAIISILNTVAPAEAVRSFVIWGLGSFAGVSMHEMPVFSLVVIISAGGCMLLCKPLNAMLLGDRYLNTMGYNVNRLRTTVLGTSSVLAAIVTAWCGPIGFIGLIVPHIARMLCNSSNHFVLLPFTLLTGALISLGCTLVSVLPISSGVLPINAVTPIVGVPVIIYIMLNTKKLKYFN